MFVAKKTLLGPIVQEKLCKNLRLTGEPAGREFLTEPGRLPLQFTTPIRFIFVLESIVDSNLLKSVEIGNSF